VNACWRCISLPIVVGFSNREDSPCYPNHATIFAKKSPARGVKFFQKRMANALLELVSVKSTRNTPAADPHAASRLWLVPTSPGEFSRQESANPSDQFERLTDPSQLEMFCSSTCRPSSNTASASRGLRRHRRFFFSSASSKGFNEALLAKSKKIGEMRKRARSTIISSSWPVGLQAHDHPSRSQEEFTPKLLLRRSSEEKTHELSRFGPTSADSFSVRVPSARVRERRQMRFCPHPHFSPHLHRIFRSSLSVVFVLIS